MADKFKGNLELRSTLNKELIKHQKNTTTRESTMTFRGKIAGMPVELKMTTTPEKVQNVKQNLGVHRENDKITLHIMPMEKPLDQYLDDAMEEPE